jgi:hypothetical protein
MILLIAWKSNKKWKEVNTLLSWRIDNFASRVDLNKCALRRAYSLIPSAQAESFQSATAISIRRLNISKLVRWAMRTPEGGQAMPLLSRFKEPTGMSKWQVNEIIEGLKEERERVQEKLNQIDAVLEDMQDEQNHM